MVAQLAIQIGVRILEARASAGLSQTELARRTGVGYSILSRLERGLVTHPRQIHLRSIARVLGRTFEDLIADDAATPTDLLDGLSALTGEPDLSRSLLDLARNWGLLSPSDRKWTLQAIERALVSLVPASAESQSEEIQSTGRSRVGVWHGWFPTSRSARRWPG